MMNSKTPWKDKVKRADFKTFRGNCFLGIDAGSTTTKLVVISEDGTLLYSLYGSNEGNPLQSVINMLKNYMQKNLLKQLFASVVLPVMEKN